MRVTDVLEREMRAALARAWLIGCDEVGRDASLHGRPLVRNLGRIEIGAGLVLSSLPVRSHLVTGPHGVLRIGDRVHIAHGASISAHAELVIGDDVVIGPFAMLLDSDYHDSARHDSPGVPRPIRIGRGVRLGAGVVVLRGAVIGDGAVIDPHSVVNRYVPGAVRASGVPARPVILP
jgi:maltose O-acetyltransferase